MITATHKGNQTTRNSSLFKKIPKLTTNPTHNLPDYSSSEDESYTHATTPPKPKDNQAQHIAVTAGVQAGQDGHQKDLITNPKNKKNKKKHTSVHNSLNHCHFSFIQFDRFLLLHKVQAIGSSTPTTS